jgi:spore coat protein U-like protein
MVNESLNESFYYRLCVLFDNIKKDNAQGKKVSGPETVSNILAHCSNGTSFTLTFTLNGHAWSASHSDRLTLAESDPGIH